jgi:twitching motility protein PilT
MPSEFNERGSGNYMEKDLHEIPPMTKAPFRPPDELEGIGLENRPDGPAYSAREAVPSSSRLSLDLEKFTLEDLLRKCVEISASDIHLEVGAPPVFRIRGDIVFTDSPPLVQKDMETLSFPLMSDAQCKVFHETGNMDLAYELPGVARFRVNILKQYHGVGTVFRVIPEKIPTMESLGLPEVLKKVCMSSRGIVIVTGPTGSGKSTSLAAMINYTNNNRKAHIITIEDPIEFTHRSIRCLIDQREVGHHTKSFADALRAALREDPNIVLVGEMRDLDTTSLAITAAEMGVLVFGTLHTNSAAKTIDRIIDIFPAKQQDQVRTQLSQSLKAVLAQQLLKTADGKGRAAAFEVMLCNTGLANLIREGKTNMLSSFMQMGVSEGMQTMDSALIALVREGRVSLETALEKALDLTNFRRAGFEC